MESILSIIQCIAKTGHSYILLDESVENKKAIFPIQCHLLSPKPSGNSIQQIEFHHANLTYTIDHL